MTLSEKSSSSGSRRTAAPVLCALEDLAIKAERFDRLEAAIREAKARCDAGVAGQAVTLAEVSNMLRKALRS